LNKQLNSPPNFFLPQQPLSQQGSTTSQPQAGSQAGSQPQAGSQAASQPQAGSQQLLQPRFRLNKQLNSPPNFFLPQQPLSQQGSATSQPQAGSQAASQPQVGSQAASQPQAGSQQLSQPLLHNLSNRPNALALTELLATIAIASSAGTITRRIVRSPWK
jgi:hypothetical protein